MISFRKVGLTSIPGLMSGLIGVVLLIGAVAVTLNADWNKVLPSYPNWIHSLVGKVFGSLAMLIMSIKLVNHAFKIFKLQFNKDDYIDLLISLFASCCLFLYFSRISDLYIIYFELSAILTISSMAILVIDNTRYQ